MSKTPRKSDRARDEAPSVPDCGVADDYRTKLLLLETESSRAVFIGDVDPNAAEEDLLRYASTVFRDVRFAAVLYATEEEAARALGGLGNPGSAPRGAKTPRASSSSSASSPPRVSRSAVRAPSDTLHVVNVHKGITPKDVERHFDSPASRVVDVEDQKHSDWVVVTFASVQDAAMALLRKNGSTLRRSKLAVNFR
eukprot:m51a1_g14490 hypothetical protein (196) ;mRNA; f:739974-741218